MCQLTQFQVLLYPQVSEGGEAQLIDGGNARQDRKILSKLIARVEPGGLYMCVFNFFI